MGRGKGVGGKVRGAGGNTRVLWDSVIPDREGRRGGMR